MLRDLASEERVRYSEVHERQKYAEAFRKKLRVGPQFSNRKQRNMARQAPNHASPLAVSPGGPEDIQEPHGNRYARGAVSTKYLAGLRIVVGAKNRLLARCHVSMVRRPYALSTLKSPVVSRF